MLQQMYMYFYCILAKSLALGKPPLRQSWTKPCKHLVHITIVTKLCMTCTHPMACMLAGPMSPLHLLGTVHVCMILILDRGIYMA